jgi:hypothetical protein
MILCETLLLNSKNELVYLCYNLFKETYMKAILLSLLLISSLEARVVKIKTYDKISFIKHALMIKATGQGAFVKFEWSEPHSDFEYFLQIYRQGTPKAIGTMRVKNRSKTLKFVNEKKKLYWRVFAKSKYGNVTSNKKKFLVPLK